jgi:peptidoglycan-N-acetylglucosamine deacetylase
MRTPWIAALVAGLASVAHADPDAPAAPVLDVKDLATLTADPVLGKASRTMGDDPSDPRGVVAFTFDDGPNPETTPRVIAALEKYDVPATFFIVTQRLLGKHGATSRDVLATELAGGFTVGSHSVTHPNLGKATGTQLDREIDASVRTLATQANRPIGLFRPPYGALSGAGRMRLKKLGLTEVIWSVDTLDWRARNADRLRKKVIAMVIKQNGGIVLMHDVKPITAQIIASVLDDLEAENCKRLAAAGEPIIPVSLHYFLKDGKEPRALPDAVKARTAAYRAALPARCAARPVPAPAAP